MSAPRIVLDCELVYTMPALPRDMHGNLCTCQYEIVREVWAESGIYYVCDGCGTRYDDEPDPYADEMGPLGCGTFNAEVAREMQRLDALVEMRRLAQGAAPRRLAP